MKPDNSIINSLELASQKTFALEGTDSETLVIYCADPRFRTAFQDFIRKDLGINQHTLLSVAGGAGPFVLFEPKVAEASQLIDQLRIFVLNNVIKKVIVLSHTDCKWYAKQLPDCSLAEVTKKTVEDLRRFVRLIQSEIADLPVEPYLADIEDDKIRFRKVPAN